MDWFSGSVIIIRIPVSICFSTLSSPLSVSFKDCFFFSFSFCNKRLTAGIEASSPPPPPSPPFFLWLEEESGLAWHKPVRACPWVFGRAQCQTKLMAEKFEVLFKRERLEGLWEVTNKYCLQMLFLKKNVFQGILILCSSLSCNEISSFFVCVCVRQFLASMARWLTSVREQSSTYLLLVALEIRECALAFPIKNIHQKDQTSFYLLKKHLYV